MIIQIKLSPSLGLPDDGFVSINISKYLMNREVGFGRKVLQILEDLNIRFEHMPTGIDDLSIVLRNRELTPIKEAEILRQLKTKWKLIRLKSTRLVYYHDCR